MVALLMRFVALPPWAVGTALLGLVVVGRLAAAPAAGPDRGVGKRPACRISLAAGSAYLRPGRWGALEATVVNPADAPAVFEVTAYFPDDPQLQFVRRILVPARSSRLSFVPLRVPERAPSAGRVSLDVRYWWRIVEGPGAGEVQGGSPRRPLSRLAGWIPEGVTVGVVTGRQPDERTEEVYETLGAALASQRLPRRTALFQDAPLVIEPYQLDGLDVLVIASDEAAAYPAALSAIRDWTLAGGRLWIMLDRVSPDAAARLLGDAWACAAAEATSLTEVALRSGASPAVWRRTFEQPVRLVRLDPAGVSVAYWHGRWPAAMWVSFGAGRVLVTALEARAWARPRRPEDPAIGAPGEATSAWVAGGPLAELAARLFAARGGVAATREAWRRAAVEEVGYRIAPRGVVAGVLGAFWLVLAAAAWRFRAVGRLERLGWAAPLAALAAAAVLAGLGARGRQRVPPTAVTVEHVLAAPGAADAAASGAVAVYNPDASEAPLGADGPGVFALDQTGLEGQVRRLAWRDGRSWRWERLELPPGVRAGRLQGALELRQPLAATATLTERGLEGRVTPGAFSELEDAVLYVPRRPVLAVRLRSDGRFTASADDVLPPGQFAAGALVSERDRRRRSLVRAAIAERERNAPAGPAQPVLLAWASPPPGVWVFRPDARRASWALLELPVRLDPAPPGTAIRVPPTLLPFEGVAMAGGRASTAYNAERHEWLELSRPAWSWLRFHLPAAARRMAVEAAWLTVDIQAPGRVLEAHVLAPDGQTRVVGRAGEPDGPTRVALAPAELLEPDEHGSLLLALRIVNKGEGEAVVGQRPDLPPWRVRGVELELAGRAR